MHETPNHTHANSANPNPNPKLSSLPESRPSVGWHGPRVRRSCHQFGRSRARPVGSGRRPPSASGDRCGGPRRLCAHREGSARAGESPHNGHADPAPPRRHARRRASSSRGRALGSSLSLTQISTGGGMAGRSCEARRRTQACTTPAAVAGCCLRPGESASATGRGEND